MSTDETKTIVRGYQLHNTDEIQSSAGYGNIRTHMDVYNEFRFKELKNYPEESMSKWRIVYHEGGKISHVNKEG